MSQQNELFLLGLTLQVTTIHNETFIGEVFCYKNPILILKESILESDKYNLRYMNTKYLTEYKIISIKDLEDDKILQFEKFNIERLLQIENEVYENIKNNKDKINEFVDENIQLLFNDLSNIFQGKWDNDIMVFPTIDQNKICSDNLNTLIQLCIIKAPYQPENCEGKNQKSVERLRQMLTKSMNKISKKITA